ncbi:NAD-dependent epimerase/dehydratase family protein [Hydrogenovibrio marinus]|uniref:Epimerase n=1 Tax=Hydrogenovibrio marinus TaxID=28885 RepID=A0A066ZWV5_HYDMR|nr:NAD(P)-dependent oxidoreductase [Hydrogenovibrio marinus]KDN96739.1 epimerase [Hydrogenovibrio marinus]BBN58985.1 hypothetical protein HVMH_0579 [Hydrogenovibrio marinus]
MKIAILGATSQIAKDLILSIRDREPEHELILFSRSNKKVSEQFELLGESVNYPCFEYVDFNEQFSFDVIINFIGIGDPAAALDMGRDIFEVTEYFDNLVLNYLRNCPSSKYIFISSGAVFGGNFERPVDNNTTSVIHLNQLQQTDWYGVAKLNAEAKHRAIQHFDIVDVRVFNYFSSTLNVNARFLITDIIRAIKNKEKLQTAPENIVRDFITPVDFYYLISRIIQSPPGVNFALDCYTKEPVDKFSLLNTFSEKYGLEYCIKRDGVSVNATGAKLNYYSINKIAYKVGYQPSMTSLEGVLDQVRKMSLIS